MVVGLTRIFVYSRIRTVVELKLEYFEFRFLVDLVGYGSEDWLPLSFYYLPTTKFDTLHAIKQ